ncbi:unnamed protein product [Nippostrongylus brasiliensis]|uniref:Apoptosis inhibitory protein 5 n=1 Tax=Nippostrongylus brasiliensis TaxID=27835 RepID=A0A0N4XIH4_NIPBR|nr:unnamed protein product [Nippostrongylus brasiliensis]
MIVDVSTLYDICQRLDESDKKESAEFQFCIDAVKATDIPVKKLAIQVVFRFFDDFPDKGATALNTIMSQLRHPDVEVQKLVIKGLPSTCHHHPEYIEELLCIRDSQELLLVKKSMSFILTRHPKATILAMYNAITRAETIEDKVEMLKFMDEKVTRLHAELTPFMRGKIADVYSNMLVSATPDEIELLLLFIRKSKQISDSEKQTSFSGALERLLERGIRQDQEEDIDDPDRFSEIVNNVVKIILILNSVNRSYFLNRKMTEYLFSKFNMLHRIHSSDRKDIMKVLSTITFSGNFNGPRDHSTVVHLFNYLKGLLPDPCADDEDMDDGYRNEKEWDIEFTELELASMLVYNILKQRRSIAKELAAVGYSWKPRFQYLVSVIRVFTRRLKEKLDEEAKKGDELDMKNSKLLTVANNVGFIANCFLVNICDLHAKISPSWIQRKRRISSGEMIAPHKRRRS